MSSSNRTLPSEFLCPISQILMNDPVTLQCGHTFDKINLIEWFSNNINKTCPTCRTTLALTETANLKTNWTIKQLIENHLTGNENSSQAVSNLMLLNLVEIKMKPFDISTTVQKLMPLKRCDICARDGCFIYLWTRYYCKKDWESLGCKNCDNFINKKRAYRGKNDQVFCELCIENNKKAIIKYNESQKPCVKSFNINKLPEETEISFYCHVCLKKGLNEELYYEVWGHSYCKKCWDNLSCRQHSYNKVNKTKAYKGKSNEILCDSWHSNKSFFSKDISETKAQKVRAFKCYNCKREDYERNAIFFDLWTHYYCRDCFEQLGCKSCDNMIEKTQAYRGRNRNVFCEKCITINYKSEEMNIRSLTQLNMDKKSSVCVCI